MLAAMQHTICKTCGVLFSYVIVHGGRSKYCSQRCRKKAWRGKPKPKPPKPARPPRACKQCGIEFVPRRTGFPSSYCSKKCAQRARPRRKTAQCVRCGQSVLPGRRYCSEACREAAWRVPIQCKHCDSTFHVRPCEKNKQFCGTTCRQAYFARSPEHQRAQKRAQQKAARAAWTDEQKQRQREASRRSAIKHALYRGTMQARSVGKAFRQHLRAAHCVRKRFRSWWQAQRPLNALALCQTVGCQNLRGRKGARLCEPCRHARRLEADRRHRRAHRQKYGKTWRSRAQRLGVPYERVDRMKVFERDGWICQLCFKPAKKRYLRTGYRMEPTLDHRIPITWTDVTPGHVYSNVQCAHRECNQKKSNNSSAGQLPLLGHRPEGVH